MLILTLLILIASTLSAVAQDYGQPLFKCGGGGILYGGSNLKGAIEALRPGQTLRLKAGTYTLSGKVRMQDHTLLAPAPTPTGGCQKAIIKLTQPNTLIIPGNESIIEGLHLSHRTDCTANNDDESCNQRRIVWVSAERPTRGVRIRHNTIGPGGDLIYVGHGSVSTLIKHNRLRGARRWCVGIRGRPNQDTTVRRNLFESCAGDYLQAEYQNGLLIDRNHFKGGGTKQIFDIKAPTGPTAITNNIIDCEGQTASCILFHNEESRRTDDDRHAFEGNTITGCGSNERTAVFGGKKPGYWYHLDIQNNTWRLPNTLCKIEIMQCRECRFNANQVSKGYLVTHHEARGLRITNNQFVDTKFKLDGNPYMEGNTIGPAKPLPPPQVFVYTTSSGDKVRVTIEQIR